MGFRYISAVPDPSLDCLFQPIIRLHLGDNLMSELRGYSLPPQRFPVRLIHIHRQETQNTHFFYFVFLQLYTQTSHNAWMDKQKIAGTRVQFKHLAVFSLVSFLYINRISEIRSNAACQLTIKCLYTSS